MRVFQGLVFSAATVLVSAFPALAATVQGYDRQGFAANFSEEGLKTQTFDTLKLGPIADTAPVGITATGGDVVATKLFLTTTGLNGIGSGLREYFLSSQSVTFNFTISISAFAIDINTFATKSGAFVANLGDGTTALSRFEPFPKLNSRGEVVQTGQFLGFSSDTPFNSVTIANVSTPDTFTLDTLQFVPFVPEPEPKPEPEPEPAVVPLPAGMPLLMAALGLLAVLRRRNHRVS